MDLVIKADRMPREGETLLGRDLRFIPGGKGANQAVAAARLGAAVTLLGKAGEDYFGACLLENLEREKVYTGYLERDNRGATGTALVAVNREGKNSILTALGVNETVDGKYLERTVPAIEKSDIVLVQLGIPVETVDELICMFKNRVPVILDAGPIREKLPRFWQDATIVSPNESEAERLTGKKITNLSSAFACCQHMLDLGVKNVVLKLGARGCIAATPEEARLISGHRVPVVDTTAAGDAFTAGLAFAYVKGRDLFQAAEFANYVGALAVTKYGAQPSLPTADEVARMINQTEIGR